MADDEPQAAVPLVPPGEMKDEDIASLNRTAVVYDIHLTM